MKAGVAGIFSSARLRLAIGRRLLLQARRRRWHAARGRSLELFALSLCRRDSILDRLANRVVGVGRYVTRALRRLARPLHGLAAAQLDRLAAQAVDLLAAGSRRDVGADRQADETAEDEPAKTAAAVFVSHR